MKEIFKIKSFEEKSNDKDYYEFKAIASTTSEDRHGDVITDEALSKVAKETESVPMLYGHNNFDTSSLLGKMLIDKYENGNLYVTGQMPKKVKNSQDIYNHLKFGSVSTLSVGFIPKSMDKQLDEFHEIELVEVSVVPVPANPEALITEVKNKGVKMEKETVKKEISDDQVSEMMTMLTDIKSMLTSIIDSESAKSEEEKEEEEIKAFMKGFEIGGKDE